MLTIRRKQMYEGIEWRQKEIRLLGERCERYIQKYDKTEEEGEREEILYGLNQSKRKLEDYESEIEGINSLLDLGVIMIVAGEEEEKKYSL